MGKRIPQAQIDKRRDIVASLLARGMRQSEIVAQLGAQQIIRQGKKVDNPSYMVNPNTEEPFDKATISRDVSYLRALWQENAEVNTDEHYSRQFAELQELKRAAWYKGDLALVERCIALEMKLTGTPKPEKVQHRWDDEQLGKIDRLKPLFQGMRQREGENGHSAT